MNDNSFDRQKYASNVFVVYDYNESTYKARLHTFGIGLRASRDLVKSCAIAGNGGFQFATEGEDITPKVISALAKASLAACTGVKIYWPSSINVRLHSPLMDKMPIIFANEPFIVLAIISNPEKNAKIILEYQETCKHEVNKLEAILPEKAIDGKDIYQLAVKQSFERITEFKKGEMIQLSMKYSVLSKETAFIAVQRNKDKVSGSMETIKIPIAITKEKKGKSKAINRDLLKAAYEDINCFDSLMEHIDFKLSSEVRKDKMLKDIEPSLKSKCIPVSTKKVIKEEEYKPSSNMDMDIHFYKDDDDAACFEQIECAHQEKPKPKGAKASKSSIAYTDIIDVQELRGSWSWNTNIFHLIAIKESDVKKNVPAKLQLTVKDDKILLQIWVTILVIAKLEADFSAEKGSWQMIFKKSVQWLQSQGIDYNDYKADASKILH